MPRKTTDKEFALFQKEFKRYQKMFGLTGYKVYFKCEPLSDAYADLTVNQCAMVGTAKLNLDFYNGINVKEMAKHEAIHLLLARLQQRAYDRFGSGDAVEEAVEELVRRLEGLIV